MAQPDLDKHLSERYVGACHRRLKNLPKSIPPALIQLEELSNMYSSVTFDLEGTFWNSRQMEFIYQTIALYPLAVDGKNFQSLTNIFTPDVMVNMSMGHPMVSGLTGLEDALRNSFDGLQTHHQLGVSNLRLFNRHCEADTITYFTTTISGTGKSAGKVCHSFSLLHYC